MASVFMDAIFYFRNFLMLGFLTFFARNIAYSFLQKKILPPGFLEFCFFMQGILKPEHAFRGLFCYLFFAYPYGASAMVKFKAESVGDFARA